MKYYGALVIYYAEFKGELEKAINYSKKEMVLAEQMEDPREVMRIKMNIGALNIDLEFYDTSIEFLNEACDYYESTNNDILLCYCYLNLGDAYKACEKYEKAKGYLSKAIHLSTKENEINIKYFATHGLGMIASKEKDYQQALQYLKAAIALNHETKSINGEVQIYLDLIDIYMLQNNYEEALNEINHIEKKIHLTEKKGVIKTFYKDKAMICEKLGDVDEAYQALNQYVTYLEEEDHMKSHQSMNNFIQEEYAKTIKRLETIATVGRELTRLSDIDEVLLRVRKELMKVLQLDVIGIGEVVGDQLCFNHYFSGDHKVDIRHVPLNKKTSLATWCIDHNKEVIINDLEEEYDKYISNVNRIKGNHYKGQDVVRSLMYAPLKVNDEIIGVFTIQSCKKNVYSSVEVNIFNIIADYVSIAVKNVSQRIALENLSERDTLTKMYNRRGFIDFFNQHIIEGEEGVKSIGIIMLDLDFFKSINDVYGHFTGDEVLVVVANCLMDKENEWIRSGRLGGEEFGLILLNKDKGDVIHMAESIREDIENLEINIHNQTLKITTSVGVSFSEDVKKFDYSHLYFEADNALYLAKHSGRNTVMFYTKEHV